MGNIIEEVEAKDTRTARTRFFQENREELQTAMHGTSMWDGSSDHGSDATAPSTPRQNDEGYRTTGLISLYRWLMLCE